MSQRHWWHYLKWTNLNRKTVSHIQGSPGFSAFPHWAMPNFRLNLNFYCWPVCAFRLLQGGSGNERRIERRIWASPDSRRNVFWISCPWSRSGGGWIRLEERGESQVTNPHPNHHHSSSTKSSFFCSKWRGIFVPALQKVLTQVFNIFLPFIYFQLCFISIFETSLSHGYIFVLKLNFQVHPNLVAREDALEYVEVLFF